LPLIPDYDGQIWDGGAGWGYGFMRGYGFMTCAERSCSIELVCGHLIGYFKHKSDPTYLPPPGFTPAKGGGPFWHCELEIVNCEGAARRVGIIGPGPDSPVSPVLDSDGEEIAPGSLVMQRIPSPKERKPNGELASPWEWSMGKWEFDCGCLKDDACDITPLIQEYPYLRKPWRAGTPFLGGGRNCNTFASWILMRKGIDFKDWPSGIDGLCDVTDEEWP
jgi:hypothetical protein